MHAKIFTFIPRTMQTRIKWHRHGFQSNIRDYARDFKLYILFKFFFRSSHIWMFRFRDSFRMHILLMCLACTARFDLETFKKSVLNQRSTKKYFFLFVMNLKIFDRHSRVVLASRKQQGNVFEIDVEYKFHFRLCPFALIVFLIFLCYNHMTL